MAEERSTSAARARPAAFSDEPFNAAARVRRLRDAGCSSTSPTRRSRSRGRGSVPEFVQHHRFERNHQGLEKALIKGAPSRRTRTLESRDVSGSAGC